jgi:hypothetical protein
VEECARRAPSDLDVILYCFHDGDLFETVAVQKIKALRQTFHNLPIVILSAAKGARQPRCMRTSLNSVVQGMVSTMELPAALAAIRPGKD